MKAVTDLATKITDPKDLDKVLEEVDAPVVEKKPIYNEVHLPSDVIYNEIPHWAVVRRVDDKSPLGVVSARYGVAQYKETLDFLRAFLEDGRLTIPYAKLVGRGSKLHLIMRTSHKIDLEGGDAIDSYITLSTTQDGTGAIDPRITPIHRASNTVLTPMGDTRMKTRHSVHVMRNLSNLSQMLGEVDKFFRESPLLFKRFIDCPVDKDRCDTYLRMLVKGDSTRAENVREAIYKGFLAGKVSTIGSCKGSLFGLLIASQLYADQLKTVRKSKKRSDVDARFEAAMCGEGAKTKALAFWTCERLVGEWGGSESPQ